MKKWGKRFIICALLGVIVLTAIDIGLHLVSRTDWFNTRLTSTLQHTLGREIKLRKMGANLRGIFVEGFAIAEPGGFENGTFIEAGHLRLRVSLMHLLHGHAKIHLILLSNITIKATVNADGSTNWQDFTAKQQLPQEKGDTAPGNTLPLHITAARIQLENTRIIYTDNTVPHTIDIGGLTIIVNHFSLRAPFPFYVHAQMRPTLHGTTLLLPVLLKGTINLQELDLSHAYADIKTLAVSYNKGSVTIQGQVKDFQNPQADLQASFRHISAAQLAPVLTLPPFELDRAEATIKLAANIEKSALTLHHLSVKAPGVTWQAKGGLLYANPQAIEYDFSTDGSLILGEMGRWLTALAEPYRLVGTVVLSAQATHQQMSGKLALTGVGGAVPQVGNISDINTAVTWQETMDFQTGNALADITGKLNGHPFTASLQAAQTADKITAKLHLKADEILLPALTEKHPTAEEAVNQASSQNAWPLPPADIQARVEIGKADVPYFYGKDIAFTANLQNLTPDLARAQGSLRLTTGEGKIQDLYKLTNANPLTKVLFLSLNITGKVFNSLNVLGVLNSIGSGLTDAVTGGKDTPAEATTQTQTVLGPDGEPLEIPVIQTNKKADGELDYDKFDTSVQFVQGVATVKEGIFVSPTMSFRLDGTTDFNTQVIDLTVHAAPGRHEVDGMLPLTLNIGGTIENPQGSMKLLESVTSLVTQSVTNNVVSRHVGKGVKGILGLFQKKAKDPEPATPIENK